MSGSLLRPQPGKAAPVWKPEVDTFADLPLTGNQDGDLRLVNDEDTVYTWDASSSSWKKVYSTPLAHKDTHKAGGTDEIPLAGMTGLLATKQDASKFQGRAVGSTAPSAGERSWR